jgi:hypothetical protein
VKWEIKGPLQSPSRWEIRKQLCFLPSRAWVEKCCLGEGAWFVLGEELLPFLQGVNKGHPSSTQEEPIQPIRQQS